VHHPCNLNVGRATRTAVAAARKEFLFWQTVDWSYDLGNLRTYLELLNHFDVVQGIRPTPVRPLTHIPVIRSFYRVKSRSDTLWKAVVSLGNYYMLRIFYGAPFHDLQNVTFYPTKLVQDLELVGDSAFVNPELLLKTHAKGVRFIEVPIPFIPRTVGEAKGTRLPAVLRALRDVTLHWFLWGRRRMISNWRTGKHQVFRTSEPYYLSLEVIRIVAPLFPIFASSDDPRFGAVAEDLKQAFEATRRRPPAPRQIPEASAVTEEGDVEPGDPDKDRPAVPDPFVEHQVAAGPAR
jgi:hypothetical protein